MSLVRNVLRSISEVTGVTYQAAAHISRNASAFYTAHEQIQDKGMPNRDTNKTAQLSTDMVSWSKKKIMKEKKYFLTKVGKEKKQYFSQIKNMQKQSKNAKKKIATAGIVRAQTTYDFEKPDLWKKVKAMYTPIYKMSKLPYQI